MAAKSGSRGKIQLRCCQGQKGIGIQPAPQGSAADLSYQALGHHLLLDIGDGESRERKFQTMRKPTGEGLYLNDDAGGERAGRPPRGCSSRPGRRAKANRLRHLLTICRGVSKRVAMTSLGNPWAAKRTILARITSRYGDVYFRARVFNFSCSSEVSTMRNGLERDKEVPSRGTAYMRSASHSTTLYVTVFMLLSARRVPGATSRSKPGSRDSEDPYGTDGIPRSEQLRK